MESVERRKLFRIDWIAVASSCLAATVYLNSFKAGFVYDDSRAILSNQDILPNSPWTDMWTNDFWGTPLSHSGSHKSFRPLTTLSFRLNYYFSGFSPGPYHVTNVILHTLTTWLFVRVARIILRPSNLCWGRSGGPNPMEFSPNANAGKGGQRHRRMSAILVSSLLFACHPIHTEAVAGVVGRADVGSTALALTAFLAYVNHVKYREKYQHSQHHGARPNVNEQDSLAEHHKYKCPFNNNQGRRMTNGCMSMGGGGTQDHKNSRQSSPVSPILHHQFHLKSLVYLAATILLATGAMLTKEQGITILLICATYDLIRSIIRTRNYQEWSILKTECCSSLVVLGVSFLFLFQLRLSLMGGFNEAPSFSRADNPTTHHPSFWARFGTFLFLPVFNLALLICPHRLSYDWSMDAIPRVQRLTDPRNLIVVAFYFFLIRRLLWSAQCVQGNKLSIRNTTMTAKQSPDRRATTCCSVCWFSAIASRKCSNNNSILCASTIVGASGHWRSSPPGLYHSSRLLHPRGAHVKSYGSNGGKMPISALRRAASPPMTPLTSDATAVQHGALLLQLGFLIWPFLPASNLFFYVGFVVAERVLYMPSVGYCLLVGHGFSQLWTRAKRPRLRRILAASILFCLLLLSARTVLRNEDWRDEERLYRAGIDVNPPKSWGNLAHVLNNQGRIAEAEVAYRQALRFRSNMADVHYNLGLLLEGQGRLDEAMASYRSAIHFRPRLASAYVSAGQVLTRLGRVTEAMEVYRTCFQLTDDGVKDLRNHIEAKVSALLRFGKLLVEEDDDPSAAIKIYRQAVNMMPPSYSQAQSVYNAMGEALYRTGEALEAEKWFKEALKTKPDHIPAHLTYGKMLARNKTRLLEAESWFRRAKKIAPDDSSVYHHYGQFLSIQGRHLEAVEAYITAAALTATDYDILVGTANALRQVGDNVQAELYYEKAVELRPQEARAHMNLGAILHVNGKYDEAEKRYLGALELKPNDDVTLLNLKKLRQLQARRRQSSSSSPSASSTASCPLNGKT